MVYFKLHNEVISKDDLNLAKMENFNLGPMLLTMVKYYWFFIDSNLFENAKEDKEKIFTAIYFEYPVSGGKSGYCMISEYNPRTNEFFTSKCGLQAPAVEPLKNKFDS